MAKTSAVKSSLEDEVKILQKHMGLVFKTVKDLKCTVEALEKKTKEIEEIKEIKEIIKSHKVIEEELIANSNAIKRIEREIVEITSKQSVPIGDTMKEQTEKENNEVNNYTERKRKCRYFDGGYCKYKQKCRYFHPKHTCEEVLKGQKCEDKECLARHPRECKWERSIKGCMRNKECAYLHGIQEKEEVKGINVDNENVVYKCESCKSSWNDKSYVVDHVIRNMNIFLCLNCNDWIRDKEAVLDQGWTLLDEAGFLRYDI